MNCSAVPDQSESPKSSRSRATELLIAEGVT